jgi:hypothetical protein
VRVLIAAKPDLQVIGTQLRLDARNDALEECVPRGVAFGVVDRLRPTTST